MTTDVATQFPVQQRVALRAIEIQALELAARGKTQREIGEQIGRTRSAVGKMLRRVEIKLAAMLKETGEQIKARQTVCLETLYREALNSWEISKRDSSSVKTVSGVDGGARTETTTRTQVGDPRFLAEARGALQDIRRIWSLEESPNQSAKANVTIRVEYSDDFFGRRTVVDAGGVQIVETPLIQDNSDDDDGQED